MIEHLKARNPAIGALDIADRDRFIEQIFALRRAPLVIGFSVGELLAAAAFASTLCGLAFVVVHSMLGGASYVFGLVIVAHALVLLWIVLFWENCCWLRRSDLRRIVREYQLPWPCPACPVCGYELSDLPAGATCPECGEFKRFAPPAAPDTAPPESPDRRP